MISFPKLFSSTPDTDFTQKVIWEPQKESTFSHPHGIHIWKIRWTDIGSQQYLDYLSDEEYRKILCYRNPKDRNKRIISRGILNKLSAKYLNLTPNSLTLLTNPLGKPYFASPYNHLQFNISHSTDFILMAFDFQSQEIGIDIEENNLLFNYLEIANQYFSESEKTSLNCKAPAEQFFKIWTRKEALIKAKGIGLTDELLKVGVLKDKVHHEEPYFLKTFNSGSGYIFSLASKAPLKDLHFIEY